MWEKYLSKTKSLKKGIWDKSFEKEALQKSNDELHIKIDTLEIYKQPVQSKCEDFEQLVLKLSHGQENLTNYLALKGCNSIKKKLGIIPLTKRRCIRTCSLNQRLKLNLILHAIIA